VSRHRDVTQWSSALVIPWQSLGLQARFTLIVSLDLLAIGIGVVVLNAQVETGKLEATLRATSESELLSLNPLVSSAMEQRGNDQDDGAVKVINRWFERRNIDYPGKLWSVWGAELTASAAPIAAGQQAPDRNLGKPPRDAVDSEALRTGQPVGRFVGATYRYSLPIIVGVTAGTEDASCRACHGAGQTPNGVRVLAVFSSSLATAADFAARRGGWPGWPSPWWLGAASCC
jgi:methyl-accepting chemotaxis protein